MPRAWRVDPPQPPSVAMAGQPEAAGDYAASGCGSGSRWPQVQFAQPIAVSCMTQGLRPGCLRINDACIVILLTASPVRTTQFQQPRNRGMYSITERVSWYRRSLAQWNLDVVANAVVVVSSAHAAIGGSCGPSLGLLSNLELIAFEHSQSLERFFCRRPTRKMGEHELIAVGVAMRESRRINARSTSHVLKLTGRYYVPGIATHLRGLRRSTSIIRQGGTLGKCEAMGCMRGRICRYLFRCPYENSGHCEATQRRRMNTSSLTGSTLQLPWMQVMQTFTGSGKVPIFELEGSGMSASENSSATLVRRVRSNRKFA